MSLGSRGILRRTWGAGGSRDEPWEQGEHREQRDPKMNLVVHEEPGEQREQGVPEMRQGVVEGLGNPKMSLGSRGSRGSRGILRAWVFLT